MNIFSLKNKKPYSIAAKHLQLFLFFVAVPVLFVLIFSGFLFRQQLVNMIYLRQEAALRQYAEGIDTELQSMAIIASSLIHNKSLGNYTRELTDFPARRYLFSSEIERILNTHLLLSRELAGFYISFIDDSPPMVLRNFAGINLSFDDIKALTEMAETRPGLIVFSDTFNVSLNGSGNRQIVSLAVSPPRDFAAFSGIKTLIVSFVVTRLVDFVRQRHLESNSSRYISDSFLIGKDGIVLVSNKPELIGMDIGEIEGSFRKSSIIMKTPLATTGWILMEAVNIRSLTRQVNNILYALYIAISLIIFFFIRYNSFFFARILSPLLDEIKNEQKERLKSEIEALRYQVNPHFLGNTLNTIRMMAIITKNDSIKKMTTALMALLDDVLTRKDTVSSLEHELRNLDNYIYIMKVRYGDIFEYLTDVDISLLGLGVPSMILQPLVENAILHGFHEPAAGTAMSPAAGKTPTIVVSASRKGPVLSVSVRDNGRGIDDGGSTALFSETSAGKDSVRIGLSNVRKRITLAYGPPYDVDVFSLPGEGTVVTLTLPVMDAGVFQ
jgi:two-component system sensor histidine kinase YesM